MAIRLYLIPLPPYRRRSYSTPSLPTNSIRIGYPALGLFIDFKRLRKRANYSTPMPWKQLWENFANFVLNADCCGATIGCLFPWFTPRQGLLYIWTKHWKNLKLKMRDRMQELWDDIQYIWAIVSKDIVVIESRIFWYIFCNKKWSVLNIFHWKIS